MRRTGRLKAAEARAVERFRAIALQLWDEVDYRIKVALALHELFPAAVKACFFDVDAGARVGGVGHTVGGEPSDRWDDVAGGRQCVERLRRFRTDPEDPFANVPVTTRQLFRNDPDGLQRAREDGLWPNGAHYQLRTAMYDESGPIGHVSVLNARAEGEFTARDRDLMEAVVPSLIEASTARRAIGDRPLEAGQLGDVLDAFDEPALLCTGGGAVLFANAAGREIVAEIVHWVPAFLRGDPSARTLARVVRVEHRGRNLYLVIPPITPPRPAQWRLPPRLAQVADLLAQGLKDREIAAALGVSPHSVRTYVTRVYQRLGVSSRVEVARLVARHRG